MGVIEAAPFEVDRGNVSLRRVAPTRVVPTLDVTKQCDARFGPGLEASAVDQLALQAREEALCHGVVIGFPDTAHGSPNAHLPAAVAEGDRGVLGEFNRSSQHFTLGGCDRLKEGSDRPCEDEVSGTPSRCALGGTATVWAAITSERSSEEEALVAGVSQAVGTRWFRECGGIPPSHLSLSSPPATGRCLSLTEREQIALLRAQGHGVREIARRLERCASTISRELRRNAATRGGCFSCRAITAQWHADRAVRRPKCAKLATNATHGAMSKAVWLARLLLWRASPSPAQR